MGRELLIPKEQSSGDSTSDDSDLHCDFSKITYRKFEFTDVKESRQIFLDYWSDVNSTDLHGTTEFISSGEPCTILTVDAKVLQLHEEGISIQLAILNGQDIVGLLLHRVAFDCVLAIDGLYVYESFRKHGIGKSLIDSLEKPIKKLIFQTRILKRPHLMFGALENMKLEPKKIQFKDNKIVWECDWRSSGS